MGDLSNKFIDESYGSLLKTTEDTGLSGTTKTTIQDGNGVDTALSLSTDKVDVNGELQTSGTTRVQGDGELVNVSGNVSQFTNDAGYLDGLPVDVLRIGDNVSELNNNSGYLTAGTIPSNVMKEGENVSLLTNDAGYLTSIPSNVMLEGENNSLLNNDSGYISSIPNTYLESGDNVSELVNDSGYLTSIPANVMLEGENNSLLNNDSGFITGVNDGTLQVAGGVALPNTKIGITDNLGNDTGLSIEKGFGVFGFENDTSLTSNAALLFKNNYWDVNNSPFANAGTTGILMKDQNNATTFQFSQNRFGGVNYYTAGSNQPHIFQSNGNSRIDVNSFGNANNSDNWHEAYNSNINNLTLNGDTLEAYSRNNGIITDVDLSSLKGVESVVAGINISIDTSDPANPIVSASGGGGAAAQPGLSSTTRGIKMGSGNTNDLWRLTYVPDTYGTASSSISNNQLKVVALQLTEGQTIRDFSVYVSSAGGVGNVEAAIYKSTIDSNGQLTGGALEASFGTFLVDTTGQKIITGIDHVLTSTEEDVYFLAIHNKSGASVGIQAVSSTNLAGPYYHGTLFSATMYRGNTYHSTQSGSLPTTIDGISFNKSTDFPIFGIR